MDRNDLPDSRPGRKNDSQSARSNFSGLARLWSPRTDSAISDNLLLDPERIFVATSNSGHGITHGTIAGILIADLITGRENEWERLYDPSRKSLRAAGELLRENVNVAKQYVDYITPGEVRSDSDIPAGQGAIVVAGPGRSVSEL